MHSQTQQDTSNTSAALKGAHLDLSPGQTLYTVEQFARAQPAFTAAALRNLIFKAQKRRTTKGTIRGNGLLEIGAVVRVGRKVLLDADRFFAWVRQQNGATK
ncbi:hypothetical protein [Methyloceanibacter sp.]|uniref:hypothetical protein n=1 Tax=Methyloceanibacter sp. TaxID=1965321 RepID=UPI003D6CEAC8